MTLFFRKYVHGVALTQQHFSLLLIELEFVKRGALFRERQRWNSHIVLTVSALSTNRWINSQYTVLMNGHWSFTRWSWISRFLSSVHSDTGLSWISGTSLCWRDVPFCHPTNSVCSIKETQNRETRPRASIFLHRPRPPRVKAVVVFTPAVRC